jgi:hypothetical protein
VTGDPNAKPRCPLSTDHYDTTQQADRIHAQHTAPTTPVKTLPKAMTRGSSAFAGVWHGVCGVIRDKEVLMRFPSQMSDPSFNVLASAKTFTKKTASGGSNVGGFDREIAETNRRLDGVARNQNASPEQVRKLEDFRRQFNERMSKITEGTTDRAKQQEQYRAARRDLSEQLTSLFGGPRAS